VQTKEGRVRAALVTGAGRRIGAGLATELGRDGWYVFVHYNESRQGADEAVAAIRAAGGMAEAVGADLADAAATVALASRCAAICTGRDMAFTALINNASRFEYDTLATMADETWQRHMNINLRAPILLAREFARHVPDGEQGCVINIIDNKVFALNPDYFSYTISKIGLQGAVETMAMALAPRVRVCGIAPGIVLPSDRQTQAEFERAHSNNPLRHGASVGDLAGAVRFILATPSFTGKTIVVDGGQTLCRFPRDIAFMP
jgi:NAD(P)-dependent dehydrogenase (short-subunit alcohol dehydrogenase family)